MGTAISMRMLRDSDVPDGCDATPVDGAVPASSAGTGAGSGSSVSRAARRATVTAVPATAHTPVPGRRLFAFIRETTPGALLAMCSIGLLVGFWHLATEYRWDFYIRFGNIPGPVEVFNESVALFGDPKFLTNITVSLRRIMFGFFFAAVLGVTFGLLIGRYALLRGLMFPAMEVLRPIPAIAWVPISIMLWPTTETSIVFITFLGSFFPILLNTVHGVASVDRVLVRAARCLGAGEFALMTQVVLRGAMPHIFTGLAVGMGVAWVSLIAAEMISGQFGVGYFTWEAYALIEYSHIVIGMIVIGVLGLLCSGLIRLLAKVMMPWQAIGGKEGGL